MVINGLSEIFAPLKDSIHSISSAPIGEVSEFISEPLKIDGLASSMQGEMAVEYFKIWPPFEDLIWITGYEVEIIETIIQGT